MAKQSAPKRGKKGLKTEMGHHTMYPFPKSLPAEDIQELVSQIRQGFPDPACAHHCAWVVYGYGAGKLFPHKDDGTMRADAAAASDEQLAEHLEKVTAAKSVKAATAIWDELPWEVIVPALIDLLRRLWQR